jgi:hypothetical protein
VVVYGSKSPRGLELANVEFPVCGLLHVGISTFKSDKLLWPLSVNVFYTAIVFIICSF